MSHTTGLALAAWLLLCAANAAELQWQDAYVAALQQARHEGRPLLVSFGSEFCGWCRLMDRDVWTDPRLVEALTRHAFLCVKVDTAKDTDTAMAFQVASIPRTVLVNRDGQVVGDHIGFLAAERVLRIVADASADLTNRLAAAQPAPLVERVEAIEQVRESVAAALTATGDDAVWLDVLGASDPAVRSEARAAVLAQGDRAVAPLIEAITHRYLGTRIAAAELLAELTGADLELDPWAPAERRHAAREAWRAWHAQRPASPPDAGAAR